MKDGNKMHAKTNWSRREIQGKSREFLADEPLRALRFEGCTAIAVKVRLTSYRSLPLSCVESIQLCMDGKPINSNDLRLSLGNEHYKMVDFAKLSKVWWFILDYADLIALTPDPIGIGVHEVEGTLVTVEPYMTAGRFSFTNTSRKCLTLQTEDVQ